MKSAFLAIGLIALAVGAGNAQPIKEVTPPLVGSITLSLSETRVYQFGAAINAVQAPQENIVEITPLSDRTFQFRGLNSGRMVVTVRYAETGRAEQLLVTVGQHEVRFYGLRKDRDSVAYPCDRFDCDQGFAFGGRDTSRGEGPPVPR